MFLLKTMGGIMSLKICRIIYQAETKGSRLLYMRTIVQRSDNDLVCLKR